MANTLNLGTDGNWGTKEGSVLGYNSENGNFKPLPFNFTRDTIATRVNKDGLIEVVGNNEPRIDYKDNSEGALLLEPSRTNYLPKSERLDQWPTASNATVEYGFPDPFKGNKAVKATSSSTAQSYQIYWGFTSANTYNLSVYAKRGTAKIFRIDFAIPDNGYFLVNLETGESAGTSSFSGMINTKIEPLDNDWYRISLTSTTESPNYVRMGANNQEGFLYMAFAQVEIGTYPTSYIPTSGSIGTRSAESSSQTPPDGIIGQTEGTLYWEVDFGINDNLEYPAIFLWDGTSSNRILIQKRGDLSTLQYQVNVSGNTQSSEIGSTIIGSGIVKIAIAYKENDFVCYLNGSQETSDTSGITYSGALSKISFANVRHDKTSKVLLYNTRLSNAELAALTSN